MSNLQKQGLPAAPGTTTNLSKAVHDKEMARRYLTALAPDVTKFTFQLFSDDKTLSAGEAKKVARIIHGTLDEVWPKVLALNTPQQRVGVFVAINETDFKGRSVANIVRGRALAADADSKEQATKCLAQLTACGAGPSMIVDSGRGYHFYFCTDVPRDQFTSLQQQLAAKLGTDPKVHDLPRVLRLAGTMHLKDAANPKLVRLLNAPGIDVPRWQLSELVSKLGLSLIAAEAKQKPASHSPCLLPPLPEQERSPYLLTPEYQREIGDVVAYLPIDPAASCRQCPFLRDALLTGGKGQDQGLWMLTALTTTFMRKGRELFHTLSKGHADYSPAGTDAMYDRKEAEKDEKELGWPACKKFEEYGAKQCKDCPLKGTIRSPLNITLPIAAVPAAPTEVPKIIPKGPNRPWPDGVNHTTGKPIKGILNTIEALVREGLKCTYDEFRQKEYWQGHEDKAFDGKVSDAAVTIVRVKIKQRDSLYPQIEEASEAITYACQTNKHNPVLDYFASLKWDGVKRIDKLLSKYLGAADTPLNSAISRKFMCAIIKRAKRPGCKFDHQLVLQSKQGKKKSMFGRDLAVAPDLFTDVGDLSGSIKEQIETMQGKQIIEFPELAGFSRATRERNKAAITRQIDSARLSYDRYVTDAPRSSVSIATTNEGHYLNDPTGERRYWHVAVYLYNQDAFLADKDQLYAEAITCEPTENIWLDTPELEAAHDEVVAGAKEPNEMVDLLSSLQGEVWHVDGTAEERVGTEDIRLSLGMTAADATRTHNIGRKILDAMTVLGWTKAPKNILCHKGGHPVAGYYRPAQLGEHAQIGSSADSVEAILTQFLKECTGNTIRTRDMVRGAGGRSKQVGFVGGPEHTNAPIHVQWVLDEHLLRLSRQRFTEFLAKHKYSSAMTFGGLQQHYNMQEGKADLCAGTIFQGGIELLLEIPVPEDSPLDETMHAYTPLAELKKMRQEQK
jgi:hypothetical protein